MDRITILDGGFSTQLSLVTGDVIDGDPLWCSRYLATNPQAVLQAHLDFLNAGAEIIITNSYQASLSGFKTHLNLDERSSYELIKESVRIARRAIDIYMSKNPHESRPKIAGSVGPYGACLNDGSEYTGSYVDSVDMETIINWHRPRITALVEEGVDFIAIETNPALSEAMALLTLMKEFPQQQFWLSFQCKDDTHVAHGETFKEAVMKCWEISNEQLVAIGCNCVNPKFVKKLIESLENRKIPLIIYPNSGEEYSSSTGWSGTEHSIDFTKHIPDWLNLGVKYIGGCCRTDAQHVTKVKEAVKKWCNLKM